MATRSYGLLTLGKIGALINATLQGATLISGTLQAVGPNPLVVLGNLDFSNATVTGLNNGSFDNSTFTGLSTFQGPAEFHDLVIFQDVVAFDQGFTATGTAFLDDQEWAAGSTITLAGLVTTSGGTLDLSGTTVLGIPPNNVIVNGALSGNTTITGTLAVSAATTFSSTVNFAAATTFSSTVSFAAATTFSSTVSFAAATTFSSTSLFNGVVTLVGGFTSAGAMATLQNQTWLAGSVISVPGLVSFSGVGTLDFTGVNTTGLTVSGLNNGTLSGTTSVTGTINFTAATVVLPTATTNVFSTIQPWAAPLDSDFEVVRVGRMVTMTYSGRGAPATVSAIIEFLAAIPVGFRPAIATTFAAVVEDNGDYVGGIIRVFGDGDVTFSVFGPSPNFQGVGNAGFPGGALSWLAA
jgi:hypothetical protein